MSEWYRTDLAYIHDVGFGGYVRNSLPGILEILQHNQIRDGLVVDLGCGSGISTQALMKAGYQVLGVDISDAMIAIARERVPEAEFRVESLFKVEIPTCNAVISVGECFSYLFDLSLDIDANHQILIETFDRIYHALTPGGLFLFDIVEPVQGTPAGTTKGFTEGKDWIVLVEKSENALKTILTRKIITFRKIGEHYRRDDEIHRQRLYLATDIATELQQIGFQVEIARGYGQYTLPTAHAAFIARKPI